MTESGESPTRLKDQAQSLKEIKEEQERMLSDQKSQIFMIYTELTEKGNLISKEEETINLMGEKIFTDNIEIQKILQENDNLENSLKALSTTCFQQIKEFQDFILSCEKEKMVYETLKKKLSKDLAYYKTQQEIKLKSFTRTIKKEKKKIESDSSIFNYEQNSFSRTDSKSTNPPKEKENSEPNVDANTQPIAGTPVSIGENMKVGTNKEKTSITPQIKREQSKGKIGLSFLEMEEDVLENLKKSNAQFCFNLQRINESKLSENEQDLPFFDGINPESPDSNLKKHLERIESLYLMSSNQNLNSPMNLTLESIQQSIADSSNNLKSSKEKEGKIPAATLFNSDHDILYIMKKEDENKSSEAKAFETEILELLSKRKKIAYHEKITEKIKGNIKKNLPKHMRAPIWAFLIGNQCKINKKLFKILEDGLYRIPVPKKISAIIREDIFRTYPKLRGFSEGLEMRKKLHFVLELFNYYRSDIGYIQGMAYLGAILLFHFSDVYRTFKYFTNMILGNDCLLSLYCFKTQKIDAYFRTFEFFLKEECPKVVLHFQEYKISYDVFLVDWFFSLFSRSFYLETLTKIWDFFLLQGDVVLFKTAIALVKLNEKKLLELGFEECIHHLRNSSSDIEEEKILKLVYGSKLTKERFLGQLERELQPNL